MLSTNLSRTMFLFFKVPGTPDIYTYVHTLSLHDARPICRCGLAADVEHGHGLGLLRDLERLARRLRRLGTLDALGLRSEEHTSELQSLMRISYAVFCLKKKDHRDIF